MVIVKAVAVARLDWPETFAAAQERTMAQLG